MTYSHSGAMASALAAAVGIAGAGPALASGFAIPELSAAGVGTANAMVANPEEIGAFPYNPAAMGFHDSTSIGLGALMIAPRISVETGTGSHDSQGADWLAGPLFQLALKVSDQIRLGVTVNVPFGLETRWKVGTFGPLSGTTVLPLPPPIGPVRVPSSSHPTESKVEVVDLAPSIAYRVNDALSLAAGLDLYWAKAAELNSNLGDLNGDGYGIGFNLSGLYRMDALSVGLSFRSAATVALDGTYTPRNQYLVMANTFLQQIGRRGLEPAQTASLDFDLPWRLAIGLRYEVNEALALEFDYNRTGWSEFESLEVKGDAAGALIFADTNAWEDANAYRLGLTYQVRPETQLRFGYAYDESGQPDAHFSARVPDNDRQLFSIGVKQGLPEGYSVEGGYTYVLANDRNYRSAVACSQVPCSGADVNGTAALDGDYEMHAHVIALQLAKTF